MANDPVQDRYDPPAIGNEYEEDKFVALQIKNMGFFKMKKKHSLILQTNLD